LSKTATVPTVTLRKGRRMASVLDAVLKPSKFATPVPTKVSEDKAEELEEVVTARSTPGCVEATPPCAEAGPSETRPIEQAEESLPEKLMLRTPEAMSTKGLDFIVRHASRKQLTKRQIAEAQNYAKELKYP
jgi:hypothetical protein